MPLIMRYVILLKLLTLSVTEFLYYFTYLFLVFQKTNKPKKPTGLGFLKNPGFLNPAMNAFVCEINTFCINSEMSAGSQYESSGRILAEIELYRLGCFAMTFTILIFAQLHQCVKYFHFIPVN